ncbi:chemotaxis protein CheW [Janthinobacterium svalbardensis]|uniref:chemotaxis protein CheW n=1 Tax=Janthinobacterium svalbardensis TaxID=368607 RepID=UPI002FCDA436
MTAPVAAAQDYVRVRIGSLQVGIASSCVRQALARPAGVLPVPGATGALAGVFSHQGQVIPLIDLRPWLHMAADTPCAYVLLLATDGLLAGLAVDAVSSAQKIHPEHIEQVYHDDEPDHFFRYVARPTGDDELLNLLEPQRLMLRAQAWTRTAGMQAGVDAPPDLARTGPAISLALFELAGRVLALPSTLVAEVLPCPPMDTAFGWNGPLAGVAGWRGRQVYVLNGAVFSGALPVPPTPPPLLAVLERDGLCLGLRVDKTLAVRDIDCSQLLHGTDGPCSHPLVAATITAESGPPQLLLDDAALLALCPQTSRETRAQAETPEHSKRSSDAYIVCDAGEELALPMPAIVTIVPLPADMQAPSPDDPAAPPGSFTWQGRTLPLIALGPQGAPTARIVVIEHATRHFGLLVRNLVTLVPAYAATKTSFSQFGGQAQTMITLDSLEGKTSYRVWEPEELAGVTSHAR